MPHLTVNGVRLHYTDSGQGDETIVFSHGLLMSGRMFDAQVAQFSSRYRCITYDHRGQGNSDAPLDGYDMETVAEDAAALIRELANGPVHFAGLSMGGFVGMRLALRHPELLRSLIILESSADPEPEDNKPKYRKMNFVARWFGLGVVVDKVMPIMFGQSFLTDPARAAQKAQWRDRIKANDRKGIVRAVNGVIDRVGVYQDLDRISTPTLILVGDEDVATVPAKSERMRDAIAGAEMHLIPGAGHSATIEEPAAVNAHIKAFLARV